MITKDEVAPYKCVNGEMVPLSDAEREAIAADRNALQAKRQSRKDAIALEEKRRVAVRALEDWQLARAALDPTAPKAVKDWADKL